MGINPLLVVNQKQRYLLEHLRAFQPTASTTASLTRQQISFGKTMADKEESEADEFIKDLALIMEGERTISY